MIKYGAVQALRAATAAGKQAGPAPPGSLDAWLAQAQEQISSIVAAQLPAPPHDLSELLNALIASGSG